MVEIRVGVRVTVRVRFRGGVAVGIGIFRIVKRIKAGIIKGKYCVGMQNLIF